METTAAVIEALERAPRVVIPLVREIPSALRKRRPSPRKWSAHEHACHLAHVHRLFFERLEQMLASPAPVITPYDPGRNDPHNLLLNMDLEESLQQYADDRQRLVARLRTLSSEAWNRPAEHGEYSHYSVFIMFRHLALHDFFHAYRIEELLLKKDWNATVGDPVEALVLDLLEWIGPDSRPYAEVIDAWRTSCPRLPVWEEANSRGLIGLDYETGVGSVVTVSAAGRTYLTAHRPRRER